MRTGYVIFLGVLGIAWSAHANTWDNPPNEGQRTAASTLSERRTPGWLTRARHAEAASELADADRRLLAGRWRSGLRRYRAVVANWPDSAEAVLAQRRLAEALDQRKRYEAAFTEYQYLTEHYGGRFPYVPVLERQYAMAMGLATGSGRKQPWARSDRALPLLEKLLVNAPQWEQAPAIQATVAAIHEHNGDYDLALTAYTVLQQRYPATAQARAAAFNEVRCMTRMVRKRPNDEALAEETSIMLRRFLTRSSDAIERNRAQAYLQEVDQRLIGFHRNRADFYDRIQRKPAAALIVYEEWLSRFPETQDAAAIRQRMDTLRAQINTP